MWELLESEEPLHFHWLASESSSGRRDPSITYPLWPFKKDTQYSGSGPGSGSMRSDQLLNVPGDIEELMAEEGHSFSESESDSDDDALLRPTGPPSISDSDDDAPLRRTGTVSETSLANRGPGMSLPQDDVNPFDNNEVEDRNRRDPWRGFKEGMIVIVRPADGAAEVKTDGFWLGQLVATPGAKSDEERDPDDFYVGVHWWARKKIAAQRKLSWRDRQCKWEPQMGAGGVFLIDAVSIGTIGCEVFLNTHGTFKKDPQNLDYINYFRKDWFGLSKEDWC